MQPCVPAPLVAFAQDGTLLHGLPPHPHDMARVPLAQLPQELSSLVVISRAQGAVCSPLICFYTAFPGQNIEISIAEGSLVSGVILFPNIEQRIITCSLSNAWPGKVLIRVSLTIKLCYLWTVCCLKQCQDVPSFLGVICLGQRQNSICILLW